MPMSAPIQSVSIARGWAIWLKTVLAQNYVAFASHQIIVPVIVVTLGTVLPLPHLPVIIPPPDHAANKWTLTLSPLPS